ncbi:polysaccharide deacetylase family protein [Desulfosoma caldarium]|uniref:Polysaccharide deacetylase n=1 Tax=Desulfosoma caldarium TaxID=610254 RepID=A0A3N1VJT8_9BACT|nr:polysaccharide deacetylase family protein [Desulfosoma caldarium]ROR03075.1 polysaccharide deacetylase [Desulfosoma caldarium]
MDEVNQGRRLPKPRVFSALWRSPLPHWRERLEDLVQRLPSGNKARLFFRADDIGAAGYSFDALCALFREHGVPLALAVVPAWLTETRTARILASAPLHENLWGWHQHGWRHVNWQKTGKKAEFGHQRPLEKQWRDIWRGNMKLLNIFQDRLLPVFTPPWNRCSATTLEVLAQLGFQAVSTMDPLPKAGKNKGRLKNLRIAVDLHTRKHEDGPADYAALLQELRAALNKDTPAGIMIHHQRMTSFAFTFLDELLRQLRLSEKVEFLSFQDLLENP